MFLAHDLFFYYKTDIDNVEDVSGRIALHAVVEANNLELVRLLVERGADVYHRDKTVKQGGFVSREQPTRTRSICSSISWTSARFCNTTNLNPGP